jgi:septal ring factor EnvC (AmiA/AmiB activator)
MNTTPTLVQAAVQRAIVTNPTAGSETAGFQFYCMNSGSMGLRMQITSTGEVLASSFVNTSDMRFKEDIQPIENALDKITRLNGVYFKWNQEYRERLKRGGSEARQVGLVAQQVNEVIPEIVAKMRDQEAGDYLAVDYNRLVPVLIQAIKELKDKETEAMKEQQFKMGQLQEHNDKLLERIAVLERTVKQFAAS